MSLVRIIATDPTAGQRLRLAFGLSDPDEIYLADEDVLPEQILNPDARRVTTHEMIFLDEKLLLWLVAAGGEVLRSIERMRAVDVDSKFDPT